MNLGYKQLPKSSITDLIRTPEILVIAELQKELLHVIDGILHRGLRGSAEFMDLGDVSNIVEECVDVFHFLVR